MLLLAFPAASGADPWNPIPKHGDNTHKHITREAAEVWPTTARPDHEIWEYLDNGVDVGGYYTGDDLVEGCWEQDYPNADMRWMEHFWDADNSSNPYNYGYDLPSVYDSAYHTGVEYWNAAVTNYDTDPALAYYYLGNVAHLLEDMSVPEHAKLHAHAFADTYEGYVLDRYTNWNSTTPYDLIGDPVYATSLWVLPEDASQPLLFRLFYHMNQRSDGEACIGDYAVYWEECYNGDNKDRFGNVHGEFAGVRSACDIGSSDFNAQAHELMPMIFQYVAGLYALFTDRMHEPFVLGSSLDDLDYAFGEVDLEFEVDDDGGEPGYATVTASVDSGTPFELTYDAVDGTYNGIWDATNEPVNMEPHDRDRDDRRVRQRRDRTLRRHPDRRLLHRRDLLRRKRRQPRKRLRDLRPVPVGHRVVVLRRRFVRGRPLLHGRRHLPLRSLHRRRRPVPRRVDLV